METTKGDRYNIACPHCGKANHYVDTGIEVKIGKIISFWRQCFHCRKIVHYHANYEVKITAYSEDPFKSESARSSL